MDPSSARARWKPEPPGFSPGEAQFGIPYWTTDVDALLARPDVDVIDLAVHASQRRPLIARIAAAGKPVLSQKPFALNLEDARAMVEACARAGVPLMVNQQARWAPGHAALRRVLDAGVLGHVYSILHVQRSWQDEPGSWYVRMPDFNIVDHGIHWIDLSRHFTGLTPRRVSATTTMVPGQAAVSPIIYTIALQYAPEAQAHGQRTQGVNLHFQVADIASAMAVLAARGVRFAGEPRDEPWGARIARTADPDGNAVELIQWLRGPGA